MKESHSDRVRRKHMRSRAKWAMLILLVLIMGIVVEFARLELGNHAVAVTAPFRPQYSANEEPYRMGRQQTFVQNCRTLDCIDLTGMDGMGIGNAEYHLSDVRS